MILGCNCTSTEQDKLHGKNKRVHNKMNKNEKMARCTVCKNERSITSSESDKSKSKTPEKTKTK